MFCREIIAVCSEIHTKYIHTIYLRNMGEVGKALCILRLGIILYRGEYPSSALAALSLWQESPFPIG